MTNTIPNVPRDLLERVLDYDGAVAIRQNARHELRALLSASPPAGVAWLSVVAYEHVLHMELGQKECFFSEIEELPFGVKGEDFSATYDVTSEPLCRLSDATAIIDGLRGGNADLQLHFDTLKADFDQQAQRIGELEGLLRTESARVVFLDAYIVTADAPDTGKVAMLADSGTLRECIDAALSAGKEGE